MPYRIILLIALLTALLVGCQPTTSKSENSTEQVCKDLLLFQTSFEQLKDMKGTATPAELDAQWEVVRRNFQNLTQAAANLETVELSGVDEALTNLADARDQMPEDATTDQILTELEEELAAVAQSVEQVNTDLKCAG